MSGLGHENSGLPFLNNERPNQNIWTIIKCWPSDRRHLYKGYTIIILELFPHLVEREVLVGWFAHLCGLSLLKFVQFLLDLLYSFYLTVMNWFGYALWCQNNDQTWFKNNIMVKLYLKSVPWRTSHIDHGNTLRTLARSLKIWWWSWLWWWWTSMWWWWRS